MMGSALLSEEETPETSLSNHGEVAVCKPGRAHTGTKLMVTLTLGFPASRTRRNLCHCLSLPACSLG